MAQLKSSADSAPQELIQKEFIHGLFERKRNCYRLLNCAEPRHNCEGHPQVDAAPFLPKGAGATLRTETIPGVVGEVVPHPARHQEVSEAARKGTNPV